MQRPLVRARAVEAMCPHCQLWYDDDKGVRAHWARRHAGEAVPVFFQHRGPAALGERN